ASTTRVAGNTCRETRRSGSTMKPLSQRLAQTTSLGFVLGCFVVSSALWVQDRTRAETVQEKGKDRPEAKAKQDQPKKKVQGLPLKPDRTIEFTTDEGTWVSLDISPDGKTILFELLGDLYTVPIAGGEAKAITTGMAFDSQPRYSPDGKFIAFVSDRDGAE